MSALTRLARLALAALAVLCAVTLGAGVSVARMLPARLALFQLPRLKAAAPVRPGLPPPAATGIPAPGAGPPATPAGLAGLLGPILRSGRLGSRVGAMVADVATGRVLYSAGPATPYVPASTTKLATAVAALQVLGPSARFTTKVVTGPGPSQIVLVGGGDPTLAAGRPPAADYPQPATLAALAAQTAAALRARHVSAVRLRYDSSLFTGPALAPGWPGPGSPRNYGATGNVGPVTALEVDQGRLTSAGKPEDADDPGNLRPRSVTPAAGAARAFAVFLRRDKITVAGPVSRLPRRPGPRSAELAAVSSPPVAQIVQWMLTESNNTIAEFLARQVAIATGRPATFGGGAAAVTGAARRLGISGLGLVDGSGLSPLDRITPRALVTLIAVAARSGPPPLRAVISGLPVAGFSGTLGPRSVFGGFGAAALGTVRAKTGNLATVAALAGLARARDGQLLAFAFMGDQLSKRGGLAAAGGALAELATVLAGCGCR